MTIKTLKQTILVEDVAEVIVTNAAQDEVSGDWVREIRILRADEEEVFILRLATDEKDKIDVTAPVQQF